MERTAWTDERLDDLSATMRVGFARQEGALTDLSRELRSEINDLRQTLLRVGGGVIVGLVGVIAAVLVSGG